MFSGNVPGVAVTSLVRSLLLKAATLGKAAVAEALLAALFARGVAEADAELGQCLAVTYWPGGDEAMERAALEAADAVVVYGGADAVATIRSRTPVTARFVGYGPKVSFGVVGRSTLTEADAREAARGAALDASTFDQQGCVSPHLFYVEEGGPVSPDAWAAMLAGEMAAVERELPRGVLAPGESSSIRQLRAEAEFAEAGGGGVRLHASAEGTAWTVVFDPRPDFSASCLNRVIRVKPVASLADVPGLVERFGPVLQTVGVAADAESTRALAGALARYQAAHGIVVDSILGEETVKSLNQTPSYRLGQIAANLERHRWMPRTLGTRHILVNVPAFRLEAWDAGKKALDMKVIVGEEYENRRTAVFSDTMTTVVFRPYWFVTDDIANEELWPKAQADPNYLAANNYETFQEGGQTRIRQTPGEENSLGLVKFLFPNDFNIYLHDTPNRELFGKDVRAFSHGCIRVEKPAELAQWVLGWDAARVQAAMTGTTDNVETKVPQRVPVYITYFTVYTQDGQLRFGNDLYDRDAQIVQALTAEAGQKPETVQAVETLRKLVAAR